MNLNTTIKEVLSRFPRSLVGLTANCSVQDAIATLNDSLISSLPILTDDKKNLHGFVDILDILAFLVKTCTKNLADTASGESFKITTDDMRMLMKRQKDFRLAHLGDIIDFSQRNPYSTLDENKTIRDAVELFAQGIHRVAVLRNSELISVLTQSDIIVFLATELMGFPKFQEMKVRDCAYKTNQLVQVTPETVAIDAFLAMHEKGKSSVAITKDGVFRGTLSASDIRLAKVDTDMTRLLKSTYDFMIDVRKTQERKPEFLVTCVPESTLAEVVQRMNKDAVHRVFVVDKEQKALGVISMTDIMRQIHSCAPTGSH